MADIKISNLPAGTVAGTSLIPIVVGGVTSQTTAQEIADLTTGSTPPALNLYLYNNFK